MGGQYKSSKEAINRASQTRPSGTKNKNGNDKMLIPYNYRRFNKVRWETCFDGAILCAYMLLYVRKLQPLKY